MTELRKEGDKDSIIFFLTDLLYKLIYKFKPKGEDYIFLTEQEGQEELDELKRLLEGIPTTTRIEVESAKFIHDSEQGKWRQIIGLLNEALLLGKFRGTSPPTISETGYYPLKINSSGELEVSLSATSALNINVEDVENLLTDIKAIITYTGDDFETVQDAIRTAVEGLKTSYTFTGDNFEVVLDAIRTEITAINTKFTFTGDDYETVMDAIRTAVENLTFAGDSFEVVVDALKAQIDKLTFDGSNNLKLIAG